MNNLLDFLQRHFHWILFVVLEIISLVLVVQYNHYQNSVWVSSANSLAGSVHEGRASIESYFTMKHVNESLTLRNIHLERQLAQLRRLYAEKTEPIDPEAQKRLDSLSQYKLIPAKVISNELDREDNLITINIGKSEGVAPGMGVVCGQGIVGVTYLVGDQYSVVIPVLNSHSSRISCAVRGQGYFGVLRWHGEDARYAFVEDIPRHARFKRGDWVETNGYSSIFPAGVLVGRIEKAYNSPDGLSYRLKVRLTTDFGRLRDVAVISDQSFAERMRIMQAARDSLKLNVQE